jgi:hypothetical protein
MQAAGISVPQPQVIQGLIDTGASCTCIDTSIIAKLGLQATGTTLIHTPSTGTTPHKVSQFDVAFFMFMDNQQWQLMHAVLPIIGSDFSAQNHHCLVGRDILARGAFFYNGQANTVTLTF